MKPFRYVFGIAIAVLLILSVYFSFFYKWCEEPSEIKVTSIQLQCVVELFDISEKQLRSEACLYIGRSIGCDLTEADLPKIREMLDFKVLECTKKALEKDNYCVDQLHAGSYRK